MLPLLLALSLVATQGEDYPDADAYDDEEEAHPRFLFTAWGGQTFDRNGERSRGGDGPVLGGEVAYAFDGLDLGVAGYGYRFDQDVGEPEWRPVLLLRVTQRFETRRGVEAALSFGLGGARPEDDWDAWFQVALGVRVPLGPLFLAGEIAFEQNDLLKLAAGLGVRF